MAHKLETLLADVNGNTFLSIDTVTIPKLTGGASNPMQGLVRKITIGSNVMVFTNKAINGYAAMVARRLVAEGKDPDTFQLGERQWGERLSGTPFVRHNGVMYLEVIFLTTGNTHFEYGARHIDRNDVIGLKETREGAQGGLENNVVIRTIKFDNIKRIVVNKQAHVL